MKKIIFQLVVISCFAFSFGACSTVQSRIKEYPQVYSALSPEDKQLVFRGRIREGMEKIPVYMAWGSADDIARGQRNGESTETWNYYRYEHETITTCNPEVYYDKNGVRHVIPHHDTGTITHRFPGKRVEFTNGYVSAWEESLAPTGFW